MNALERKAQIAKFRAVVAGDPCFEHNAEKVLHKHAWSPERAGLVYLSELVAVCGGIDENRARHYLLAAGFVSAPSDDGKERWQHQPWYLLPWPAPDASTTVDVQVAPIRTSRRGAAAAAAAVGVGS